VNFFFLERIVVWDEASVSPKIALRCNYATANVEDRTVFTAE